METQPVKKAVKYKKFRKILLIFNIIVWSILLIVWLIPKDKEPISFEQEQLNKAKSDSIKHAEKIAKQFTYDGSHIKSVDTIKELMNDPNSFENVKTTYIDCGETGLVVHTKFRGKNVYGGVVTQMVISHVDTTGKITALIGFDK